MSPFSHRPLQTFIYPKIPLLYKLNAWNRNLTMTRVICCDDTHTRREKKVGILLLEIQTKQEIWWVKGGTKSQSECLFSVFCKCSLQNSSCKILHTHTERKGGREGDSQRQSNVDSQRCIKVSFKTNSSVSCLVYASNRLKLTTLRYQTLDHNMDCQLQILIWRDGVLASN